MCAFYPEIIRGVMAEVESSIVREGKISDEALLSLHVVFGSALERALALLDKRDTVTILEAPSGRKLAQVAGTAQGLYTLYCGVNFCPCAAFQFYVLGTQSQASCKHALAAWLAPLLGKHASQSITELNLQQVLRDLAATSPL